VPTPSGASEAGRHEETGRVMAPRHLYARGHQEHPHDVQRGKPPGSWHRKAAVPETRWRADGTPPGSESGAGLARGHSGTWESPLAPGATPGTGARTTTSPGVRGGRRPAHEPGGETTNRPTHARDRDARDKRRGPRRAGGSLRGAASLGRWGRAAQTTHGRAGDPGHPAARQGKRGETVRSPTGTTQLQRRAAQAAPDPTRVCTPLAPVIDADVRREASRHTRQSRAAGLDGVPAQP
jgi:hypothetical protein